ncbi:MAG: carboxymuconolactone decarboxylase family protein [Gemmataceae bacterium]|nr:carboxymuconolactone decarboxylase family protein [Gemmataceae bacterium]
MTPRIQPVAHETATGRTKEMLDGIKAKLGGVPNLMRTFAQSPAALQFFLAGSQALAEGALPAKLREQIDLAVSEVNGCGYCLAAHTLLGKKQGLTDAQVADARRGTAADPKAAALVRFARSLTVNRGQVTDGEFQQVRAAGATDGELAEVIAAVALKVFTNYFAVAAGTDIDFPKAPPLGM